MNNKISKLGIGVMVRGWFGENYRRPGHRTRTLEEWRKNDCPKEHCQAGRRQESKSKIGRLFLSQISYEMLMRNQDLISQAAGRELGWYAHVAC